MIADDGNKPTCAHNGTGVSPKATRMTEWRVTKQFSWIVRQLVGEELDLRF
jgi:hypothetical protein